MHVRYAMTNRMRCGWILAMLKAGNGRAMPLTVRHGYTCDPFRKWEGSVFLHGIITSLRHICLHGLIYLFYTEPRGTQVIL